MNGVSDEDLAVAIMAAEESNGVDGAFETWRGEKFRMWGESEHSGDCTKQPWTCSRCLYEDYMDMARTVKRLLAGSTPNA